LDGPEVILVVFAALAGMVWGLVALWLVVIWSMPAPTLDPVGGLRAILLWPAWAMFLVATLGLKTGVSLGNLLFLLPALFGAVGGALGAALLIAALRRGLV